MMKNAREVEFLIEENLVHHKIFLMRIFFHVTNFFMIFFSLLKSEQKYLNKNVN